MEQKIESWNLKTHQNLKVHKQTQLCLLPKLNVAYFNLDQLEFANPA